MTKPVTNSNSFMKKIKISETQQPKKRARRGVRFQMELNFDNEEAKKTFLSKVDSAKRNLSAPGKCLDNGQLLSLLLDRAELEAASTSACSTSSSHQEKDKKHATPMLENSGLYKCSITTHVLDLIIIQVSSPVPTNPMTRSCLYVNETPFTVY